MEAAAEKSFCSWTRSGRCQMLPKVDLWAIHLSSCHFCRSVWDPIRWIWGIHLIKMWSKSDNEIAVGSAMDIQTDDQLLLLAPRPGNNRGNYSKWQPNVIRKGKNNYVLFIEKQCCLKTSSLEVGTEESPIENPKWVSMSKKKDNWWLSMKSVPTATRINWLLCTVPIELWLSFAALRLLVIILQLLSQIAKLKLWCMDMIKMLFAFWAEWCIDMTHSIVFLQIQDSTANTAC